MYSPNFYRENRDPQIHKLIRDYPFAVMLTKGGENVSHLPLILEVTEGNHICFLGHMARANPHWRELIERPNCKIIFQGPHAYISPAWYTPSDDNVPTWNYAVVHAMGEFRVVEEELEVFAAMNRMVTEFESRYETNWTLPKGSKDIEGLMKGIVVFRIHNLKFEAKFKLSQKLDSIDRENVISQLKQTGDQVLVNLAEHMAETK